jgi:hypothetical protein
MNTTVGNKVTFDGGTTQVGEVVDEVSVSSPSFNHIIERIQQLPEIREEATNTLTASRTTLSPAIRESPVIIPRFYWRASCVNYSRRRTTKAGRSSRETALKRPGTGNLKDRTRHDKQAVATQNPRPNPHEQFEARRLEFCRNHPRRIRDLPHHISAQYSRREITSCSVPSEKRSRQSHEDHAAPPFLPACKIVQIHSAQKPSVPIDQNPASR